MKVSCLCFLFLYKVVWESEFRKVEGENKRYLGRKWNEFIFLMNINDLEYGVIFINRE